MMTQAEAMLKSTKLSELFSDRELPGRIHSRFENAINIETSEGFMFNLLPQECPPNPRSIVFSRPDWNRIQDFHPSVGMVVNIKAECLEFPQLPVKISLRRSVLWDPGPYLPDLPLHDSEVLRNIKILPTTLQEWRKKRNNEEAALVNSHICLENVKSHRDGAGLPFQAAYRSHLRMAKNALFVSIAGRDLDGISSSSIRLIGLGVGLTPSGDDILSGVLATGVYCGLAFPEIYHDVSRINSRVTSLINDRTTPFSRAFLLDSALGEVVRPLGELIRGLLCSDHRAHMISLAKEVVLIGGLSGLDMLEGVLLGMVAFLRLRDPMRDKDKDLRYARHVA